MVTGKPNFLRGLEGDWIHYAPTAQDDIIRFRLTNGQPLRLLLVARVGYFDLLNAETIFLRQELIDRDGFFSVR